MKKKILGATFMVAMMAVAGYNVYMSQQNKKMSLTVLANIEALAYPEGETILTCGTHYETIDKKKKCNGDHLYSEGRYGVEHTQTTGTSRKYCKGFCGIYYYCTSPTGTYRDDVKEYDCGKDEFSGFFDSFN